MKQKEKEITDYLRRMGNYNNITLLNDNDNMPFTCLKCGKCCLDREKNPIILFPFDVYQIAKNMNIESIDVINKYADVRIGKTTNLPTLKLKTDNKGQCIFLKNKLCSIDEYKPATCGLFPLGRCNINKEIVYFLQHDEVCGIKKSDITLNKWKSKFNLKESEISLILLEKHLSKILKTYNLEILKRYNKTKVYELYNALIGAMYKYDMSKSFEDAFNKAMDDVFYFFGIFGHAHNFKEFFLKEVTPEQCMKFADNNMDRIKETLIQIEDELEAEIFEIIRLYLKKDKYDLCTIKLEPLIIKHLDNFEKGIRDKRLQLEIIETYKKYKTP